MRAFIAYRNTGEDPVQLRILLGTVVAALHDKGIEAYCTLLDEQKVGVTGNGLSAGAIMTHAFAVIDNSHLLFVVQTSSVKSEGMLMEIGYCRARNIPIFVAQKAGVENTYIPQMAQATFRWIDLADLRQQIHRHVCLVPI